jgi:signal transduction histidine kinase/ActR/RegA family two-component response regulator
MSSDVRRGGRSRFLSIGLLVMLLAGTFASTVMLRNLVRDQNRQLLHERTAEAGLVLASSIASVKPSLQVLGATYLADPSGSVAKALTTGYATAAGSATAILSDDHGKLRVRIAAGPGLAANQPLTGARGALVTRAIKAKDLVADVFAGSGRDKPSLAFAIALPDGPVVYQEVKVDPAQLTRSGGDSPFSELGGALYVGPHADASKLLFTTAPLPLHGTVDKQLIHIGADRWFLVASARHSLVGSFASTAPWIVFALGALVSVIAFGAADLLLRRRRYALALVDERTATLRQTMAELEVARCAAEAANHAKSDFLSRMSHELRTPLNAVLGFAQVLERRDLTDSQQQSVTQIIKGGQHLLGLINDVLDISRIETGNLTLSSEPVLVADVVDDALELVEPLAAQRGITCSTIAADNPSRYVLADRQRLKQVLLNLLSNAVKYNRAGGTVTISYEERDELLRIKVTDTGPGIPADRRALLFEPFERLGAEQTNIEGTGVGLSLSRRLAEAMNGVLDVDSNEGEGSTFWIELQVIEGPVEHHQRTSPEASSAPLAPAAIGPLHTILYIEDNVANVKLIEHILDDRHDIHLITAMQGRLGIELALQHNPELILLDIHLPDIGGETVLAELRASPETATTPIVVLTADATERQNARLLAAGASAYLTKPIDVGQLLEIVDTHLIGSGRRAFTIS